MKELIKVTEKDGKRAVSARELYNFLCIETPFTKWIPRMLEYGFVEGTDWTKMTCDNQDFNIDYVLSLDCAKEISMIQRTERGKQARIYFIECEKELKSLISSSSLVPDFTNPAESARAWADEYEKRQLAEKSIKQLQPKADFFDQVADSKDAIEMGEAAKVLNIAGIGRNNLFEILREEKVLMPESTNPYQKYKENGWFRTIEQRYTKPDGSIHISIKTLVYQKGLQGIKKILEKYQVKP